LVGLVIGLLAIAGLLMYAMRPRPKLTIEDARRDIARRRFHSAADALTQVLRAEPDNVRALVIRGECYVAVGRRVEARADFKRALELQPGAPEAGLGLALVLMIEGHHEPALAAAGKIAEANPKLLKAHSTVGKIHYAMFDAAARECVRICEDGGGGRLALDAAAEARLGRFESAEAYWRDWYGRKPADARESGLRANIDRAKEQFALALRHLRMGSGLTADLPGQGDIDTLLQLASALLGSGDLDAAERAADALRGLGGPAVMQADIIRAEVLIERATRDARKAAAEDRPKLAARADKATREAIGLLESVLEKHPRTAAVRDRLAVQYVRAGMFDKAERQLTRDLGQPASINARYVRGIVHLAKGEYDKATTEFLSIQGQMANDPGFHFSLGLAYYGRGGAAALATRAAAEFRETIRLRPDFVPARFRLAKLHLEGGWYEEAREQCKKILAIPGRSRNLNAQVYLMLSEASRSLKDYDRVYEALEAAYRELPAESTLMKQYLFMIGQGRQDDVIANIQALIEKEEDKPTYACILGYAYLKKGMPTEAIESFERALTLDRQYVMGYVYLAGAYESLNRPDKAREQYEHVIAMLKDLELPESPGLHYRLGVVLIKEGQLARAEQELRRTLERDRKYVPARLRLAELELRRRNLTAALEQANLIAVQAPGEPEARFLVGLIYSAGARRPPAEIRAEIVERWRTNPARRDEEPTDRDIEAERRLFWDLAVQNYEKAIELDPRFSHSYEVAILYAVRREFDKMTSVYARALHVAPPTARPRLLRRLATAQLCAGDHDKAVESAQKAVDALKALNKKDADEELRTRFTLANCHLARGKFKAAAAEINRIEGALPGFQDACLAMMARFARLSKQAAEAPKRPPADRQPKQPDADEPEQPAAREPEQPDGDQAEQHHGIRHVFVARGLNLGLLLSRAGLVWLPHAENTYETLLRDDPDNVVALHLLGDLYLVTSQLGGGAVDDQLRKAAKVNARILRLAPNFAPALRNLGLIEDMRTREAAAAETTVTARLAAQRVAVRSYQLAIAAAPTFWIAKLELAALYQRAGANDLALALYEDVIKLRPTEVRALNDYANLCAEEKRNLDKAIERAKLAEKLSPLSGAAADTLGVLHTILGEPDAAIQKLEKARLLLPNHPAVLYHLAVAYEKGGQKEKALAALDELLAKVPDHEQGLALRNKLKGE